MLQVSLLRSEVIHLELPRTHHLEERGYCLQIDLPLVQRNSSKSQQQQELKVFQAGKLKYCDSFGHFVKTAFSTDRGEREKEFYLYHYIVLLGYSELNSLRTSNLEQFCDFCDELWPILFDLWTNSSPSPLSN